MLIALATLHKTKTWHAQRLEKMDTRAETRERTRTHARARVHTHEGGRGDPPPCFDRSPTRQCPSCSQPPPTPAPHTFTLTVLPIYSFFSSPPAPSHRQPRGPTSCYGAGWSSLPDEGRRLTLISNRTSTQSSYPLVYYLARPPLPSHPYPSRPAAHSTEIIALTLPLAPPPAITPAPAIASAPAIATTQRQISPTIAACARFLPPPPTSPISGCSLPPATDGYLPRGRMRYLYSMSHPPGT